MDGWKMVLVGLQDQPRGEKRQVPLHKGDNLHEVEYT